MRKIIFLISLALFIQGCAVGGKGGRDGGDASVEIGEVKPEVDVCVGTTVECNKETSKN